VVRQAGTDQERRPIFTRLINSCWFCFKWGIALMLITLLVVGGYLYMRLDDEIRRYAASTLAAHYDDLEVKLGDARFEAGRGVVLRNLLIFETTPDRQRRQLLHVDEMQLLGSFDAEALLSGKSRVERVVIKQPRLDALRDADGRWNVALLMPPPSTGDGLIEVEIVDAVVSVADASRPSVKPLVIREVQLKLSNHDHPSRFAFEGSIGGALARKVRLHGWCDEHGGALDANIEIVELALSSSLLASWPHPGAPWLDSMDVSGNLNCNVEITRRGEPQAPLEWAAAFALGQGRLTHEDLPRPLTDIAAAGTMSHERLHLDSLVARYGKAGLSLVGVREGWSPRAPLQLVGKIDRLVLDGSIPESLPPGVSTLWRRFRPAGELSANFNVGFNGQRWIPDVTVTCHQVAFEDAEEFPYRVQNASGVIRYWDLADGAGGHLDVKLSALAEGQPIQIDASLTGFTSPASSNQGGATAPLAPAGNITLQGQQIPITTALVEALGEQQQRIIGQLAPKGLFSFRWSYDRPSPEIPAATATDLEFHDCQICFAHFPYPLSNITGLATERNGHWQFTNLVSRMGDASPGSELAREVHCHGTCEPVGADHFIRLTFTGRLTPLDDTLRQALPAHLQPHWTSLNPSGRVGFTAVVTHHTGQEGPTVDLVARPEERSVSLMPSFFRYRLEGIDGEFRFRDGQVTMTDVQAHHAGSTQLFARQIHWAETPQGGWNFNVQGLHVDRLPLSGNNELLLAAEPAIRKLVDQLQPQGTFSIHDGQLLVTRPSAGANNAYQWNLRVGMQQNDFDVGVPIRNVSGMVSLAGRYENGYGVSAGQLDLDSFFWHGLQFTKVRGPLWVDDQECSFGEKAAQQFARLKIAPPAERKVEARFYGGKLAIDATMFHARKKYTLDVRLEGAQLAQMSTEYFDSSVSLTGNMNANMTLTGAQSLDLLSGGGKVEVRDATMGELPIMVSLFKVLRNRAPDTTAFNGIDAQFRVVGKNLQFEQLDILGDAISLKGKGTVGFDRQADLVFYSYMGRHEINIPVVRTMLGQASANLMQISVTGPIDNARVSREALPAVSSMIEQFNERGAPAAPGAPTGSWWR
jgi:hypothetical protein